jgi:hypothetical protein
VQLLKFDSQRWGELAVNGGTPGASAPWTNDKEISGVVDVSDLFPHAADETVLLLDAQDHSSNAAVATPSSVEGGQLLLLAWRSNAGVRAFGVRCGVPGLSLLGERRLAPKVGGTSDEHRSTNMPAGAPALMLVGLSDQLLGGTPLPLALDSDRPAGLLALPRRPRSAPALPCAPTSARTRRVLGRGADAVAGPGRPAKLFLQAISPSTLSRQPGRHRRQQRAGADRRSVSRSGVVRRAIARHVRAGPS